MSKQEWVTTSGEGLRKATKLTLNNLVPAYEEELTTTPRSIYFRVAASESSLSNWISSTHNARVSKTAICLNRIQEVKSSNPGWGPTIQIGFPQSLPGK
jgi:hypothetical protein